MPFRTLKLKPGVDIEQSAFAGDAQLTDSNLIRFYYGLVEKLGGWRRLITDTFIGTCRGLHGWADIAGNAYLALGTEQRLSIVTNGEIIDVTPLVATDNPVVRFTTTIGTSGVTIEDGAYNPAPGDWINLKTQVSVGGLILFGYYQVTSFVDDIRYAITAAGTATSSVTSGGAVPVYTTTNGLATVSVALADHGLIANDPFTVGVRTIVGNITLVNTYIVASVTDADDFVITAGSAANASTSGAENGGLARIEYLLPTGQTVNVDGTGYGGGDYGAGDYGLDNGGDVVLHLRQWSLDHWGQDLIASPSEGAIYYVEPTAIGPAIPLSPTAPTFNLSVLVMPQVQIIVALGSEVLGSRETLLIRWCDAGNFTDWDATAFNQAGSYQIPTGSRLVGGLAVGLGVLVWTDQDLWSMTYQGLPFVFGFNRVAMGCGLSAQRAAGVAGTFVMWLGLHNFYQYSIGGGVKPVECSVWDFYFDNFDRAQLDQINCAVNTIFNEMAWFFPIKSSSPVYDPAAPLGYVKYNYLEGCWDKGQSSQYQRTAWMGHSPIGDPVGTDYNGLIQQHENGYDADGAGMDWSWQTGFFAISEAEDIIFSDLIIPDMTETIGSPTINYTILVSLYPDQAPQSIGPLVSTTGTHFIPYRARGRQMAIAATGSDMGTFNRLGALRVRYAPDGRN